MARRSNRIWFVALGIFIAVGLFTFLVQRFVRDDEVDAANMAAFDAGYIISDWQMSNYTSMSESQIQSFLNSKGRCGNTNFSGVGTRVGYFSDMTPPTTWHVENGHTVCLAEENINGKSAARIIWEAAQYYRINPQVLIVLLQKETGLITDPIPNSWDYRRATGYGCPDSTPGCSSEYAGFENQIWYAAALFRNVLDNGYSKFPVGGAWVQWSTHSECGSGWVDIKNRATSALYRYTPYQPNAAALASSYGMGDYCSQYGNRNFYSYFEDWFGGIKETQEPMKVMEGEYYIESLASSDIVLDVYGGEEEEGTNVQVFGKNNTGAQKWKITYNSKTDDYNIINASSGMALDVKGASEEDGANIQIWGQNKTCAQRWKIVRTKKDNVQILSSCSLKAMGIEGEKAENRANIELEYNTSGSTQQWLLNPVNTAEEGLYTISSALDKQKAIDISGGSNNARNGTNVHLWSKNDTAAQRWSIKKDSAGYYTIRNLQSGKVLDVASAGDANRTNIQVWSGNNTCAQKWRIMKTDDGYYSFISACSLRAIDLYGAYTKPDTNIQLFDANNSKAQKWMLDLVPIVVEEGEYQLVSALSEDKALDLSGNSDSDGANIQLYEKNSTSAQKWTIKYDRNTDYYKIINGAFNKSIDVDRAGTDNGTNVQLWSSNNTCAQKWLIIKDGDYYTFRSACSNLVLDVAGGEIEDHTNIQLFERNKTKAQKWLLK